MTSVCYFVLKIEYFYSLSITWMFQSSNAKEAFWCNVTWVEGNEGFIFLSKKISMLVLKNENVYEHKAKHFVNFA